MPAFPETQTRSHLAVALLLLLGVFLTCRGYRSLEGDQAYRLPILLHQTDATILANDPFVAYFDVFNPHQGVLTLLRWVSTPIGISPGILGLFLLTFFATGLGVAILSRSTWPDRPAFVAIVAAGLVFFAQAGNIGTNHLFEPLLLDRMIAFALGWIAIGAIVRDPGSGIVPAAIAIGLISLIHPSLGLQFALLLIGSLVVCAAFSKWTQTPWRAALSAIVLIGIAVIPGYYRNVGNSRTLFEGLSRDDFRLLCAELQSPQHMLPHLWRLPQWLAWGCYPILGFLSICSGDREKLGEVDAPGRLRLLTILSVNLVGLAMAWVGVEILGNITLTIFQPFRLATVARGLCLVLVSGHLVRLWQHDSPQSRARAALLAAGFLGDWSLVVVTLFESVMVLQDRFGVALERKSRVSGHVLGWFVFAAGLLFLSRHDTESGHLWLLPIALIGLVFGERIVRRFSIWDRPRLATRMALAWLVPLAAMAANLIPEGASRSPGLESLRLALVKRCRFLEIPIDDLERLALWCRENTPGDARFIGPPGQKAFRLWARRAVAFNRAGSPYHAEGLADWSARFREHVAFEGSNQDLVKAYLKDRHRLESRYDALCPDDLARLAVRQGATYVIGRSSLAEELDDSKSPLIQIHSEGRLAVYQLREPDDLPNAITSATATRVLR